MGISLELFAQAVCDSGLMSADDVAEFRTRVAGHEQSSDAQDLARALVRDERLTAYQAKLLYKGRTADIRFGDYVVLDPIGAGGMGQVYKARHCRMDRLVAIKVLPPDSLNAPEAVARFEQEARAAAKLIHPNIVTAFDAGESEGRHYLVCEYVAGLNLAEVIEHNGPLPVSVAVEYMLQAATGLEYAHKKNIIHRDIKPANLLLSSDGEVKILDMGLARIEVAVGSLDETRDFGLTGTGEIMGTVEYMPPEQAEDARSADGRADIYALGCTLHFLLTGEPPFPGETAFKCLLAHREQPIPSLRAARPDVSPQLEPVFQRMLSKHPNDRYQTMSQLREELAALRETQQEPPRVPARPAPARGGRSGSRAAASHGAAPARPRNADSIATTQMALDETLPRISDAEKHHQLHREKDHNVPVIVAIVAVAFLAIIGLAAVIFRMQTPKGTLVIKVNEPDATVQILDEDGRVEITQRSGTEEVALSVEPGKHRVKVEKDGFESYASEFTMKSGGKESLEVKLIPAEEGKAGERPNPRLRKPPIGPRGKLRFPPLKGRPPGPLPPEIDDKSREPVGKNAAVEPASPPKS